MRTARALTVSTSMLCSGGGGCLLRGGVCCQGGFPSYGCLLGGGSALGGNCSGGGVIAPWGGVFSQVGVCSRGCVCSRGGRGICSGGRCVSQHALRQRPPPCEQNSWHTPMKILPCPKLRLRAVKMTSSRRHYDHMTYDSLDSNYLKWLDIIPFSSLNHTSQKQGISMINDRIVIV